MATIAAAGGEAAVNTSDVSDWEGAQAMVRQALETFGGRVAEIVKFARANAGIDKGQWLDP